jgi:hypothetical protein
MGDFGLAEPYESYKKDDPLPKPQPLATGAAYQPGGPFTSEAGAAVTALVAAGHSVEVAAAATGRSRTTVWRWVCRGKADIADGVQSELAAFAHDYLTAEARALGQLEDNMLEFSRSDWRAAAHLAERKNPALYGKQVTPRLVRQVVDRIVDHVQERATAEEYDRFCELLSGDIDVEGIET